jgi:hypothetical protein
MLSSAQAYKYRLQANRMTEQHIQAWACMMQMHGLTCTAHQGDLLRSTDRFGRRTTKAGDQPSPITARQRSNLVNAAESGELVVLSM